MLRTLAINSNKKCVKFWCFDNFLITKANLKLRRVIWNPCKEYTRTVRPDTPAEGIRTTYPGRNYTTTEKELLVVVYALDKFKAYLIGS